MAHPKLMLRESSRTLMDNVFKDGPTNLKLELLRVFVEFLREEQRKMITQHDSKKGKFADLEFVAFNQLFLGSL